MENFAIFAKASSKPIGMARREPDQDEQERGATTL